MNNEQWKKILEKVNANASLHLGISTGVSNSSSEGGYLLAQ